MLRSRFLKAALMTAFLAPAPALAQDFNWDEDDAEVAEEDELEDLEAREISLPSFSRIHLEADTYIRVTVGQEQSITLYTEPDHFDELDLEVEDGTLTLEHPDDNHEGYHVGLVITVPELTAFTMDNITIAEITGVDADEFELDIDAIGTLEIAGTCGHLDMDVDGIGEFDAADLVCETAIARINGIGEISLHASEEIDVRVNGIGEVTIYGDPAVRDVDAIGFGEVEFR